MTRIAVTRAISPAMAQCELTHLPREPINLVLVRAQHAVYERVLADLGCTVRKLEAGQETPDAVFVEDAAVVLDEAAVITRPGAASRRAETAAVAEALAPYRPLHAIAPPGTLDGGDVLRLGRRLFVGASGRTNAAGVVQLRELTARYGYTVEAVPVRGCLHLKTAVTAVGEGLLLMNPDWVDATPFTGCEVMAAAPAEPFAANALLIGDVVVYPAGYPQTAERLRQRGLKVQTVEVTELAKAEGGVTCCSLIFAA